MLKISSLLGCLCIGGGSALLATQVWPFHKEGDETQVALEAVPSRAQQLSKLRFQSKQKPLDILIIGAGATGCGCAVDAATRGYKTALIEREDFASGTSSKSSKLIHGGVRYLEKAFKTLSFGQLKLVFEALHERRTFLHVAPHLSSPLPILMPCYAWWEVPYFWAGLKVYDLLAGSNGLVGCRFVPNLESERLLPTLAEQRHDGSTLKGSVLYYDGQFDDSRMAVSLALTAAATGAITLNHMSAVSLIKNDAGLVIGAKCRDELTGEEQDVYAKVVINATGPFTDDLRRMADDKAEKVTMVSSGTHVTLPDLYGSQLAGMIIPKTSDGRVLFMLPWLGSTIAGTTDTACEVTDRPKPTEEDVDFILRTLDEHLNIKVRKSDVLSSWTGLRPLVQDPSEKQNTSNVVRDHVIINEASNLLTVSGGKWTTYRLMAEDTIDAAAHTGRLPLNGKPCRTKSLKLVGAQQYYTGLYAELAQVYAGMDRKDETQLQSLDSRTAHHLASSYGDCARQVLSLASEQGLATHLLPGLPVLEAEVVYCARHEYAESVEDFLVRRTRLAFLDAKGTVRVIPRVAELMSRELGWSSERKEKAIQQATAYMTTFHT